MRLGFVSRRPELACWSQEAVSVVLQQVPLPPRNTCMSECAAHLPDSPLGHRSQPFSSGGWGLLSVSPPCGSLGASHPRVSEGFQTESASPWPLSSWCPGAREGCTLGHVSVDLNPGVTPHWSCDFREMAPSCWASISSCVKWR